MKHVDYLYFNIYNYFYRISLSRQSVNHRIQTMYLFSLGLGGWLLMMESVYLHTIRHSRFTSPIQSTIFAGSIYFLTAAFFNYIFIVRDRDQKIFGKYEEKFMKNPKRKQHFFISLGILILPYLAMLSFSLIFPRHGQI
ncbi:MAG TPA: hypothetical protein VGQ51_08700 [Puia sp.]|nr:hypothetical protein [Puia sp.]